LAGGVGVEEPMQTPYEERMGGDSALAGEPQWQAKWEFSIMGS